MCLLSPRGSAFPDPHVTKQSDRLAEPVLVLLDLPSVKAPKEIPPIRYSMDWHPRFDGDFLHVWLRETVRQVFRPHAAEVKQYRQVGIQTVIS